MGQGGHITIINNTNSKMIQTYSHSYQMEAWDFPKEIAAGERKRFYVEWCDNIFKCTSDDRGTAVYHLENDQNKTLEITMYNANTRSISVELTGIEGPGIKTSCPMQWQHDGEMYVIMDDRMDLKRWMGKTAGNTPINMMDIPGTHDSLAFDLTGFVGSIVPSSAKTQNMNIWDQLCFGCRYFDIRIDQELNGCHGVVDCRNGLNDTIELISKFLEANNTEFVLMRIKNERGVENKEAFNKKMDDLFNSYENLFWKNNLTSGWPLLNDVRGKVIVLDNLNDHYFFSKGYGYEYGNVGKFVIQDDYDAPNEEVKLSEIKENIDLPYDPEKLKINHVSAVGTAAGIMWLGWTPEDYAKYLNPKVIDFTVNKNVDCVMGVIAFDFFDSMVSSPIVINNYKA